VKSQAEWLETDGLGGFASGAADGIRTRRYHALLLAAMRPPTERFVLVNGCDAAVETPAGTFALSSQMYIPNVIYPDGASRIAAFESEPWPRWRFELADGTHVEHEIFVRHGHPLVVMTWRLAGRRKGVMLSVRPFLSGRDYHALHQANPEFSFDAYHEGEHVTWQPYAGVPAIVAVTNGDYHHQPEWYRSFLYVEERARGLDHVEDLASPGFFRWNLSRGEANLIFTIDAHARPTGSTRLSAHAWVKTLRDQEERRRKTFPSRLHRAADAYVVNRDKGKTIIAGYPWFTDWGRDTFIALRGLCLTTGHLHDAQDILLKWSSLVSEGMLPNRFLDHGGTPEFNSVDASLWYVIAVHDFLKSMTATKARLSPANRKRLQGAVEEILAGYVRGTRFGIRADDDGLLAAGVPGLQVTWMDAKVGDWVVTPRIGKPVEVQALWLNALWVGSKFSQRWERGLARGRKAFAERFWNAEGGCLFDVVDVDHCPGVNDAAFRPNQIFAVGGLPVAILEGEQARRIVEAVEARLLTPLGLRTLAPEEPNYAPRYERGVLERDSAYHQGTVWPWLLGPFVEAWLRVHGGGGDAKLEARRRFIEPMLRHLDQAGLGHVSEIADGEGQTPRGCPFQAWSVGELLRLLDVILAK